jgi:hypothetical protein
MSSLPYFARTDILRFGPVCQGNLDGSRLSLELPGEDVSIRIDAEQLMTVTDKPNA